MLSEGVIEECDFQLCETSMVSPQYNYNHSRTIFNFINTKQPPFPHILVN